MLMMLLVLVLFPRVSAQRYVRHVTQPIVVNAVLGLRRRWAVVAEPKVRDTASFLGASHVVAVVDGRERPRVDCQWPIPIAGG